MVLIVLLSENILKLFSTNFKKIVIVLKFVLLLKLKNSFVDSFQSYVDVESMLNLLSINGFTNHILVI